MNALALKWLALGVLLVGACSGGTKPPPGKACLVNTDCTNPLSCSYGACHVTCTAARDCPTGQDCIKAATGNATGNVCQLQSEAQCEYRSQCMSPLVCALDRQCRSQCLADVDCPTATQKCVQPDMVCAEPAEIDPTTNMLKKAQSTPVPDAPPDAGAGDGATGDGATGDVPIGGGGSDGGGGGNGGAGGTVAPCTNPQTTFGNPAQGDSNPNFNSSLGVRTADQFLIFSGYTGPAPSNFDAGADAGDTDAAAPSGNYVFVQAFDAKTSTAAGPATPLLKVEDGTPFGVLDVSIAPSGEIVLLYGSNITHANGELDNLWASFFSPTTAGAPIHVARTVQLESTQVGQAHAIWSVPSQAFVLSWKYYSTTYFIRIKKYLPDGTPAGGDTAVVPTPSTTLANTLDEIDSHVGVAGNLFGVVTRNNDNGNATLTVLDGDGNQVGNFIVVSGSVSPWATLGGTSSGFVSFFHTNNTVNETTIPTSVLDGGVDAGDGGTTPLPGFTFPSTANKYGKAINDDMPGGLGGVGLVTLEANGAGFSYVKADGTSHLLIGTVISSPAGAQVAITNYHGSFGVSLYDGTAHSTQMVASGCR